MKLPLGSLMAGSKIILGSRGIQARAEGICQLHNYLVASRGPCLALGNTITLKYSKALNTSLSSLLKLYAWMIIQGTGDLQMPCD